MSILIKGMEMPKSCAACPMLEGDKGDGLCHAASRWLDDDEYWTWYMYPEGDIDDSKPCNCPLIEIPPHGRLIDADAFCEKVLEIVERQKYDDFYAKSLSVGAILREVVMELRGAGFDGFDNAPTIIPADKDINVLGKEEGE